MFFLTAILIFLLYKNILELRTQRKRVKIVSTNKDVVVTNSGYFWNKTPFFKRNGDNIFVENCYYDVLIIGDKIVRSF